jgi:hypothetical protein
MSDTWDNLAPRARIDDLVNTESGNEVLIYDATNTSPHHLDALATFVWRHLDGVNTSASLAEQAQSEINPKILGESIQLAIGMLADPNLLAASVPASRVRLS